MDLFHLINKIKQTNKNKELAIKIRHRRSVTEPQNTFLISSPLPSPPPKKSPSPPQTLYTNR